MRALLGVVSLLLVVAIVGVVFSSVWRACCWICRLCCCGANPGSGTGRLAAPSAAAGCRGARDICFLANDVAGPSDVGRQIAAWRLA